MGHHKRHQKGNAVVFDREGQTCQGARGHVIPPSARLGDPYTEDESNCHEQRQQRVVDAEVRIPHQEIADRRQARRQRAHARTAHGVPKPTGGYRGEGAEACAGRPRNQVQPRRICVELVDEFLGRVCRPAQPVNAVNSAVLRQQQVLVEGWIGEREPAFQREARSAERQRFAAGIGRGAR